MLLTDDVGAVLSVPSNVKKGADNDKAPRPDVEAKVVQEWSTEERRSTRRRCVKTGGLRHQSAPADVYSRVKLIYSNVNVTE